MIKSQFANVVLVPVNFRVDIASQLWLVRNKLVDETANGFFTPVAVQCADESADFLILPNRIQITSKLPTVAEGLQEAASRMRRFIGAAGAALNPIQAVGLNAQIVLQADDLRGLERGYFSQGALLRSLSPERDLSFSASEDEASGKITTKVAYAKNVETGELGVSIDINSHVDVTAIEQVEEALYKVEAFAELCMTRAQLVQEDITNTGGV